MMDLLKKILLAVFCAFLGGTLAAAYAITAETYRLLVPSWVTYFFLAVMFISAMYRLFVRNSSLLVGLLPAIFVLFPFLTFFVIGLSIQMSVEPNSGVTLVDSMKTALLALFGYFPLASAFIYVIFSLNLSGKGSLHQRARNRRNHGGLT